MIFSYIDGGSGSMALQLLMAGALSAVYAFHTSWAAIKKKFVRGSGSSSNTSKR
jgi:hypothetical protein